MDCDFFWRRYDLQELYGFTEEELKHTINDLRCKINDALWELAELEEKNVCLDVQASARMVVIDQLLDLRTERTRDLDTYFRGVQMSVKGIRYKKRSPSEQHQRTGKGTPLSSKCPNPACYGGTQQISEETIKTS